MGGGSPLLSPLLGFLCPLLIGTSFCPDAWARASLPIYSYCFDLSGCSLHMAQPWARCFLHSALHALTGHLLNICCAVTLFLEGHIKPISLSSHCLQKC